MQKQVVTLEFVTAGVILVIFALIVYMVFGYKPN